MPHGHSAWIPPPLSEGIHTITARATDLGGNTATDSIPVTVANVLPITESGSATSNGAGVSITVTHGLNIEANDLILAFVHVNGNQRVTDNNPTSLFTEEIDQVGAGSNGHAIYSRIAGASEPATYQWTIPSGNRWSVSIRVFKNVNTSNIWEVAPSVATRNSGDGATATAPSVTTNTDGAMGILFVVSDRPIQNFTNPTNGYGDEIEATSQAQANYVRTWPVAGLTGSASVDLTTNDWMVYQLALRPPHPEIRGRMNTQWPWDI